MNRLWAFVVVAGFLLGMNSGAAPVFVCDEPTLRAAVAGGGLINFNCDGTIVLTSPLIITQNVTLNATGRNVTISGNDQVRIFEVGYGNTLHLINLTIAQGRAQGLNGGPSGPGGNAAGGAISFLNPGTMRAKDCLFLNNQAIGGRGGDGGASGPPAFGGSGYGGAISGSAAVYLTNCLFSGNGAAGGAGGFALVGGRPVFAAPGTGFGGAVYLMSGLFVAENCQFGSNNATRGGAAHLSQLQGTVSNCAFTANVAASRGGAIVHEGAGFTVTDSMFSANRATGRPAEGGAIFKPFASGPLLLERCQFTDNSAVGDAGVVILSQVLPGGNADGGALFLGGGDATINDCTFADNSARGGDGCCPGAPGPASPGTARGGAIYTESPTTIRNGTFVENFASAGGFSPGPFPLFNGAAGGAIACEGSTLRIEYSTIASNAVNNFTNSARGSAVFQTGGSPTLLASILAGNTTNGAFGENVFPTAVNGSSNLSSDSTGGGGLSSFNIDPKLGPLADNGGPVRTMALLAGSPAINATISGCLPADARGVPRGMWPGICDIGAFEQTFMRLQIDPGLNATVSYFGVPNETYALEMSFDLIIWEQLAPQPSGGGFMAWGFPGTARSVFFRVKLFP
jgi:hypothetical protein